MSYRVKIVDTETRRERWRECPYDWFDDEDGSGSEFWWTEGNFGCDCNRGLEFMRAGGEQPTFDEAPKCNAGPNRFRVPFAELPDGRRIEIDGEASP